MSREATRVIVSPEHVEIAIVPAGLGSRFLALCIDAFITIGLPMLLFYLLQPFLGFAFGMAMVLTVQFFFTFAYHVYFETMHGGRTPGKRALRLRVVDSRGLPITVAQSLVRNAVRAIDIAPMLYAFGAVAALANRDGRRLGDLAAETLVIEEPSGIDYQGQALSERRFNTLRTPRVLRLIRHRIGLEERELLLELCLRADRLDAEKRYELMEEVAGHYRDKLEVDDPRLSGENLVRDLTSILFSPLARTSSRLTS